MTVPKLAKVNSPTRERNRARIVDAARRLWAQHPDASMEDVAREAGVVRRTLYGHFAHRDDLLMAVVAHAAEVLAGIAERSTRRSSPAAAELARLTLQVWSFARDWHLLGILAQQVDRAAMAQAAAPIDAAFRAVVRKGQRRGEFSNHLPVDAMTQILQVQAIRLHEMSGEGTWNGSPEDAAVAALVTVGVPLADAVQLVDAERGVTRR